jgi:hypothetical protein
MPIFERPFESLEELHETELEYLKRMFDSGVPIAVPAALDYCARHGVTVPRCLTVEAAKMFCSHLSGNAPKGRGRSCGTVNRDPSSAMRYRVLDTRFLQLVGADITQPVRPGKKIVPLYDLTG